MTIQTELKTINSTGDDNNHMPPKKLQGQVAIITGAGRGIGAAAAERFVAAGASVVLTARSEEELEAVAARLRQQGGRAVAVPGDITDPQDVEEVVESALEQFDRVDILVNNAGIVWPIDELADSDAEEWTYNIFTNLVGPYVMARNVLPLMLEQGRGRIINVSSAAAQVVVPGASAYCAAKAGLEMWTRVLAAEVEGRGVMVNILRPGTVDTQMQEDIRSVDTSDTRLDTSYFHELHAQGRLLPATFAADLLVLAGRPLEPRTHRRDLLCRGSGLGRPGAARPGAVNRPPVNRAQASTELTTPAHRALGAGR